MATQLLIGGHVSAAGGVDKAIERAAAIGANCVQVFSGSPRVWQRPKLESIDAKKIATKQKELLVSPIVTHALYLVNLASDNPSLVEKSIAALTFDLQFDALVGGAGVVVHLGSHQGRGWLAVREQVARGIAQVLANVPATAHFLIENSAGQSGKLTSDLTELQWLIQQLKTKQLGWCLDTCHAFAAGYSLVTTSAQPSILDIAGELHLSDELKCIHVNDSRDPVHSGRDRHANLGDGLIPAVELQTFLRQPLIQTLPMILEVPGIENNGPDAENIRRLKTYATL